MKYAIHKIHPELLEDKIDYRFSMMNGSFGDVLITDWESVSAVLDLPDDNDRHVLAAAIKGGAQSLKIFNLKDFPKTKLENFGIELVHLDEFLLNQLDLSPSLVL